MARTHHSYTQLLSLAMSLCLLTGNGMSHLALAASPDLLTGDVRLTVNPANLRESLPVTGADRRVTMSFRGVDIQDALRALAQKGGFNVLLDESVTGTISVDLNNVTIRDALETLKTYGNLSYSVQGRNLMVAEANSTKGQSFHKSMTRIFPLRHANASVIANFLNNTVFADRAGATGSSSGGSSSSSSSSGANGTLQPVTADYHTNSLIVVGDPTDIKSVQEHIEALDQPRQMKTWRLSQANVLDVATILSSSLFNEGQPPISLTASGSGGAAGALGSGGTPSQLRVTMENIAEGTGASQSSQSSGSGGGGQSAPLVNNLTLRARTQQTQTIQVSPTGPILMPDTRLNTLTLLGTAEQIAMAEALIPTLDRKVPQVVLEASLVEISEDGRKELGFTSAGNNGYFSTGTNNSTSSTLVNRAFSNAVGSTTSTDTPLESLFRLTSHPLNQSRDFVYQLNALASKSKAKMLANPTVITTSDNETLVSIVDEVIRSVTVTQGAFGSPPTFTTNIGEAGIVLNILPKIGANNDISLRIRPVISTISRTERDRFGNVITLLSKREVLAQNVQLHDGETFVMGGLIHDTNTEAISRNPVLASLPIVGALGRNSVNSKHRSELVVMITPHIVNDDAEVGKGSAPTSTSQIAPAALLQGQYRKTADEATLPISMTSGAPSRNALPPLERTHVIDGNTTDPLENQSLAQPAPKPAGILKPEDMQPQEDMKPVVSPDTSSSSAPKPTKISRRETKPNFMEPEIMTQSNTPAQALSVKLKSPDARDTVYPLPEPDTSNDAIQAIIEKFK